MAKELWNWILAVEGRKWEVSEMNSVLSSLSEGLLWSIMAIGVYLTFRILDMGHDGRRSLST